MIEKATEERIREVLAPFGPAAVYVFGSAATGRMRSNSDLDLAILLAAPISTLKLFETRTQLAEIVHRDVDLIDLSSSSTVLCKEVVAGGRLLYETDAFRRAEFEMYALSDYARLNEEREPVLTARGQPLKPIADDVRLNKGQIIRRCLARIHEEYAGDAANLENLTKQDSVALNLQRACEAAIDLAMHFVAQQNLGVPQTSRDAFTLLETSAILSTYVAKRMRAMVGFRNIAIHEYQQLDTSILQQIVENHLTDFERFLEECSKVP